MTSASFCHRSSPAVLKIRLVRYCRIFKVGQQMLYFVQQKRGNNAHSLLIVVESATFRAIFPGFKPISPKLLHKIQHSPFSSAQNTENVALFAGFVA